MTLSSLDLHALAVRLITREEEARFRSLLEAHHYLGCARRMGHSLWYVAEVAGEWVALLTFSAAVLKCRARDLWIGWRYRHQYDRLKWVANNSRFLILPEWHVKNVGSRTLSLCERRLSRDWLDAFGYRLLLLETFVDPRRFHGGVYVAANWTYVGNSAGFRRIRGTYSAKPEAPKKIFVRALRRDARAILSAETLPLAYRTGIPTMTLTADEIGALPGYFNDIPDPRRAQGRRHRLRTVLAIATAATLCGMRGYKAIAEWAAHLKPKARARFGCRRVNGEYIVPSEFVIRDCLVRVGPGPMDTALARFQAAGTGTCERIAIDGKTMCNAVDETGRQTHVMSAVGHETSRCYTQKK